MTTLTSMEGGNKSPREKSSKKEEQELQLSYSVIPHEYLDWAFEQSPTILRLFLECWRADSFGNKSKKGKLLWKRLVTKFQGDNFRKAKKAIEETGYFQFRKVEESEATYWEVWNATAKYSGNYFIANAIATTKQTDNPSKQIDNPSKQIENPPQQIENRGKRIENLKSSPESIANSGKVEFQLCSNNDSTTYQQPTKVVGMVEQATATASCGESSLVAEEEEVTKPKSESMPVSYNPPTSVDELEELRQRRSQLLSRLKAKAMLGECDKELLLTLYSDTRLWIGIQLEVRRLLAANPDWGVSVSNGELVGL